MVIKKEVDDSVEWKTISFSEDFMFLPRITKNYGGFRGKFIKMNNNLPKLFITVFFSFLCEQHKKWTTIQ